MAKLSVVLPAYNEEAMLLKAAETLKEILEKEKIEYQLIFVDDGSRDQTWSLITEAAHRDSHVTGIHFSRNFGKEAAIFAGLGQCGGRLRGGDGLRPAASASDPGCRCTACGRRAMRWWRA